MRSDGRPTAGVVIIGNEVLSGKVVEQNAGFFIRRFRALGTRLARLAMIEDDLDEIAATVREQSDRFDFVMTSGGVGPTHDDVTMTAVARAFDVPLVDDPELLARMQRHLGDGLTEGHRRMARIPDGGRLLGAVSLPWPTVVVRNVYIFPGVPSLLAAKFKDIEHLFAGREVWNAALHLGADEASICEALDRVVAAHPDVEIGSYPRLEAGRWHLRLTVESVDPDAVTLACAALRDALGSDVLREEPLTSTRDPRDAIR